MNILAAFKVCPNLDLLQVNDLAVREGMGVDTHFLPNVLNCYDESSLELALRFREQSAAAGETVRLSAITVGGSRTEDYLKTLQALGYDHVVRAEAEEQALRFCPELAARTIASYARASGQDVILVGAEAPLGNHGVTAQWVSALTAFPLLASVVDFSPAENGRLTVWSRSGGCMMVQTVAPPCVLSVGNAVVSKLRVPSLRARMQWKHTPCEAYPAAADVSGAGPVPERLELPQRARAGYVSPARGEAAVEDVFARALRERLDAI